MTRCGWFSCVWTAADQGLWNSGGAFSEEKDDSFGLWFPPKGRSQNHTEYIQHCVRPSEWSIRQGKCDISAVHLSFRETCKQMLDFRMAATILRLSVVTSQLCPWREVGVLPSLLLSRRWRSLAVSALRSVCSPSGAALMADDKLMWIDDCDQYTACQECSTGYFVVSEYIERFVSFTRLVEGKIQYIVISVTC